MEIAEDIIALADSYAEIAHDGQVRKNSGLPYIGHPRRVAALLKEHGESDKAVAAGLLHDVLEDCYVSRDELEYVFGKDIEYFVFFASSITKLDPDVYKHWPRVDRKYVDIRHYSAGPTESQSIKVADMIDNLSDLQSFPDVEFREMYLQEKDDLLNTLVHANTHLVSIAKVVIEEQKRKRLS